MNPLQREDIIKLLIKIQLNFENAYVASNDLERELLVESWYEALCEYPKEACTQAVNNVLKRAKFAPRLGDITEEITKLLYPEVKTDDELWAELNTVLPRVYDLSRYLKYPQYVKWANEKLDGVYSGLSEELKLFVVNRSTLVDIAEMSPESLQFERTRFFKQMPVLKKHKNDKAAAQKFIAQTMKAQALLNGNDKK